MQRVEPEGPRWLRRWLIGLNLGLLATALVLAATGAVRGGR